MMTFFLFFTNQSTRFTKHSPTSAGLRRIAPYQKLALPLNTELFGQFQTEKVESVQALEDTYCGYRKGLGGI